ncbi:hypothetical protein HDF26_004492 [Pedobacter cryoconitis]|uniref:Methylamine utilisation protein MauE domain-containing protein n=1 Tax=Pedobacter cryoconitis TaxID=188932 RepID=A0A7W8ZNE6_9SPHI|nr:MauE/DoxX family redox-associated membrane protein [Pedobacter cryoconitis]MBB5637259.1 hypothetical protein [Pedobacter cryoconitis]MBB6274019.1 hypothetical protein [Pedobacter cryoconitis]
MKTFKVSSLSLIASSLLIMLFGYTAVSKILDYNKFVFQMKLVNVPMIPYLASSLGIVLPIVELVIVWMLCKNNLRVKGCYASFLLLFIFEIYITIMLLSGEKLPCTCGGIISQMGWKTHLVFNAVFMIISTLPIIYKPKPGIFNSAVRIDYN